MKRPESIHWVSCLTFSFHNSFSHFLNSVQPFVKYFFNHWMCFRKELFDVHLLTFWVRPIQDGHHGTLTLSNTKMATTCIYRYWTKVWCASSWTFSSTQTFITNRSCKISHYCIRFFSRFTKNYNLYFSIRWFWSVYLVHLVSLKPFTDQFSYQAIYFWPSCYFIPTKGVFRLYGGVWVLLKQDKKCLISKTFSFQFPSVLFFGVFFLFYKLMVLNIYESLFSFLKKSLRLYSDLILYKAMFNCVSWSVQVDHLLYLL